MTPGDAWDAYVSAEADAAVVALGMPAAAWPVADSGPPARSRRADSRLMAGVTFGVWAW